MRQKSLDSKLVRALFISACFFASANFTFALQPETFQQQASGQSVSPYVIKRSIEAHHRAGERRVEFDMAAPVFK